MADTHLDLHSDFDISFNFFLGSKDGGSNGATFVLQAIRTDQMRSAAAAPGLVPSE